MPELRTKEIDWSSLPDSKLETNAEREFQTWYAGHAKTLGLKPDPDDPGHYYDYRAAWKDGAEPDETGHWPSKFKLPGHPRQYIEGVNTITGKEIDLSGLPDKEEIPPVLRQAPPLTYWQKFKDVFREDPKKLQARAQNALVYSEMFNISPSKAYKYHDEISDQLGGEKITTPTLMGGLLLGPIAMAIASNPVGAFLGIAGFEALTEAESFAISLVKKEKYQAFQKKGLTDLLPEDAGQLTHDVVDTLDFIAKAFLAKGIYKKTPKLTEKITKQMITEHRLPQKLYIDPTELRTELQRGGVIAPEEMQIVKELGLKGSEYRQALKNGLHIEIPAEKITIISDRPWFAKVKKLFKLEPTERRIITKKGETTYRFGEGEEKTPGAPEAKIALLEAEAQKPVKISAGKEKEIKELTFAGRKPAHTLGEKSQTILTGGPAGGGKSTGLQDAKIDRTKFIEVNPDIIKRQAGYADQAEAFHEESSRIAKEIMDDAFNENYHIIYDSQLTNFPLADELIQDTLKKGGEAAIIFTNIDAETSLARSRARMIKGETDREVPIEASVKGYNRSLPTFLELYEKYGDNPDVSFRLFDNNTDFEKTRLVFRNTGDKLEIGDQKLFDRLLNTDYDKIETKEGIRYERQEKSTIAQIEKQKAQIYDRADRLSRGEGYAETPLEILPKETKRLTPLRSTGFTKPAGKIQSETNGQTLKSHPQYPAAKAGDVEAAAAVVEDLVKPANIEKAAEAFGTDVVYVPVLSIEETGHNKLPLALAALYMTKTGAFIGTDIYQTNKTFHTGAEALSRVFHRPIFTGPVIKGTRYVLVDDVVTMGGTMAELANYIKNNGGEVAGIISLTNISRSDTLYATPEFINQVKERFGDEIEKEFGIIPEGLTIQEAKYFLKFKDADSLRNKIASLRSKERPGIPPEEIYPEVIPPEESLTEAYPEGISTDFADHVEGYISALIDMVEIGEPGRRFKIAGTEEWTGYGSTYPDFMRDQGWTKKEVLTALRKGLEKETLGSRQEDIFIAALGQAQEMFLTDLEEYQASFGVAEMPSPYQIAKKRYGKDTAKIAQQLALFNTELQTSLFDYIDTYAKDIQTTSGALDRAPSGVKTLGVAIKAELAETGKVDLREKIVTNAEDVAVLAQIYRNPSFETFRIIYTRGDKIVAHEGITSRMPGFSKTFETNPARTFQRMKDRMRRLGADGYYMLHNHPSGKMSASENDVTLTSMYANKIPGFKGHIIIDSGEYHVISVPEDQSGAKAWGAPGNITRLAGRTEKLPDLPPGWTDPLLQASIPHELLGAMMINPQDIAHIGSQLKNPKGYITLLYRNASGQLNAIQEIPINMLKHPEHAINFLRGQARKFGSADIVAYEGQIANIENRTISPEMESTLIEEGALLDIVYTDYLPVTMTGIPYSIIEKQDLAATKKTFGKRLREYPAVHVAEEPPEYRKKAEASIDAVLNNLLKTPERKATAKAHLAEIRKQLRPKGIRTKTLIREITGQIKIGDCIKEEDALLAAMKKASTAARKAFSEGNKAGVAREKTRIRALQVRARQRKEIRETIKKMVKDLSAIDTSRMAPQEAEPIQNLLTGLDLVKRQKPTMLKLARTREYLDNNPEAEIPDYIMDRLKILDQRNLNDITFEELESIHTAVMHYAHLNKVKNQIKVGREKRRASQALAGAIAEMKSPQDVQDTIISSQPGKKKRTLTLIKDTFGIRHDHYDLIIESLAGPNSTMDRVLYQGIKEGIRKQLKYRQDTYATFQKDLAATDFTVKDIAKWLKEKVTTGRIELIRGERMALQRHALNEDNRKAILQGGFGFRTSDRPNEIYRITEDELDQILESLTPDERLFAGTPVDNLFDAQYTALNDIFYQKNGYPLPKEELYYPKQTMPLARGLDIEKESVLEQFKGRWTRVGLEKGMLEKRLRVKLPIYLNSIAYDINKSVMKSAAYVGLELPLSNASKLLYNKDFRRELSNRYSEQTWKEIEKGLRDIAGDYQSYTTVEELALKIKNNLSTAILGLNPFVMAKQVLSFPIYLPYVKAEYLIQGMVDFINHPKEVAARHKLYSPEFLERIEGGYSRDVADVFKAGAEKRLYAGHGTVKEKVMGGIKLFDEMAVIPGMQGAVLQVLDELTTGNLSREVEIALDVDLAGVDIKKLTPEEKMRLAYEYADYATERTQPMFSPEHRSSLSRGSTIEKLATMFGSFTNQALNLIRRTWRDSEAPNRYTNIGKVLFLLLVVNTAGVMTIDEIRNRIYGRKQKRTIAGRILESWSGYVFFIRDLVSSVISKIERGTFLGYDVELPIARVPELLSNVIANGVSMLTEKSSRKREKAARNFVDDAINLVLMLNGIPYETPKKIGKAALEKME